MVRLLGPLATTQSTGRGALERRLRRLGDPAHLELRLAAMDVRRPQRRLYVMGCGRSGTWLLTAFLSTFSGIDIHAREVPATHFAFIATDHPVLALKRDATAYRTAVDLPRRIEILVIVRHPYDVVTSHNPASGLRYHIGPERWRGEAAALRLLMESGRANLHVVRYEDLVGDPHGMQAALGRALRLAVAVPPERMGEVFAAPREAERAMHGLRPIDSHSVGRFRRHPEQVERIRAMLPELGESLGWFAATFGYDLGLDDPAESDPHRPTPTAAGGAVLVRPAPPFRARIMAALDGLLRRGSAGPASAPTASGPATVGRRLTPDPIVTAAMFPARGGDNICGPSLVAAPDWLPERRARFYLYFAHHRGAGIRLAVADALDGPWRLVATETLRLADAVGGRDHVASPDVHLDPVRREILMYFHTVVAGEPVQKTFLARSPDGVSFRSDGRMLADFYLRVAPWRDRWIGMAKGGALYLSDRGDSGFERLPGTAFPSSGPAGNAAGDVRHVAIEVAGDVMTVYFTRIGDAPERILRAVVDLARPTEEWRAGEAATVLVPERPWEGVLLPPVPSRAGPARAPENALRDPAIFHHDGARYLVYAGAGERCLGLARLPP